MRNYLLIFLKSSKGTLILIIILLVSLCVNIILFFSPRENIEITPTLNIDDQWILRQSKKYAIQNFIVFQRRHKLDSISNLTIRNNDVDDTNGKALVLFHAFGHVINFAKKMPLESPEHNKQTVGFENVLRDAMNLPCRLGNDHGTVANPKETSGSEIYKE